MPTRFSGDLTTRQLPLWEKLLLPLAGQPDLRFVEVGVFEGRTSCWLLQNVLTHPTARLTCIDIFKPFHYLPEPGHPEQETHVRDYEKTFDANMAAIDAAERVVKLKGNSTHVLRTLPLYAYDMVYIDGSHANRDALRDVVLGWDLLKTGGIMIMDDYGLDDPLMPDQKPKLAIDAFLASMEGEYALLAEKAFQVAVRKEHIWDLSRTPYFELPRAFMGSPDA
jgi:predicted O-methyltransferase YrrM